ncbi:unnamed protein product [Adineta ricciae]|uniref:LITAF domain-containing protein n=1 Tax=Adineta ricciae TaxID=249248 RepID=A0A816EQG3_ADIRI|nr:unnamed protein product [Adineta ricciae]CAF1649295.1 unnamed protein product [Adineta ricciae]
MTNVPPPYYDHPHESTSHMHNVPKQNYPPQVFSAMSPTGPNPMPCTCPYCHQAIISRVENRNGALVWIIVIVLCLIGCVFGCCLIPFFMDSLKDVIHICPVCQRQIGRDKKL